MLLHDELIITMHTEDFILDFYIFDRICKNVHAHTSK